MQIYFKMFENWYDILHILVVNYEQYAEQKMFWNILFRISNLFFEFKANYSPFLLPFPLFLRLFKIYSD